MKEYHVTIENTDDDTEIVEVFPDDAAGRLVIDHNDCVRVFIYNLEHLDLNNAIDLGRWLEQPVIRNDYKDIYIPVSMSENIILERVGWMVKTNVPHLVMKHSPTGYKWGYDGSGSADLALNILENVLRMDGYDGETDHYSDGVFKLSLNLYKHYKRDVIARLPLKRVTIIRTIEVISWIKVNAPFYRLR